MAPYARSSQIVPAVVTFAKRGVRVVLETRASHAGSAKASIPDDGHASSIHAFLTVPSTYRKIARTALAPDPILGAAAISSDLPATGSELPAPHPSSGTE